MKKITIQEHNELVIDRSLYSHPRGSSLAVPITEHLRKSDNVEVFRHKGILLIIWPCGTVCTSYVK